MPRAPKIAKPCSASWANMRGDDRVRHCTSCDHKVYNLSRMTEAEASNLLQQHEGRICVRFYQRADGTVMTRDCGLAERARLRIKAVAVGALTMFGFVAMPVTTMGARTTPRGEMRSHMHKVRMYSDMIKEEKDPEARQELIQMRNREAELAKAAARRAMEEDA